MKPLLTLIALALAGCILHPEPKTRTIDCGDLYLDSLPDPMPPAPADTFVVKDGECRRGDAQ